MNISLFIIIFVVVAILICLMQVCYKYVMPHCCSCCRSLCLMVKNKLMYNSVIRGLLEAYFLMSIAAVYQVANTDFDKEGNVNFIIAIFALIYLVAFPILSLWYLLKNKD